VIIIYSVFMDLTDHRHIFPKSFLEEDIIEGYHKDYMFLDCIRFINTVSILILKYAPQGAWLTDLFKAF
jgi:hypothetical protein